MDISLNYKSTTAVIDTKGAELKKLRLSSGKEIMWEANPRYWGKSSPVLFPVVGTLNGNKTIIDGIEYSIPRHGFARNYEFSYSQITQNDVTFSFSENEDTLKIFPFNYLLKIHYRLLTNRIRIMYTVKNNSKVNMPYCIGAHPAFSCPFNEDTGGSLTDYRLIFEKPETVNSPLFNSEISLFSEYERTRRLNNSKDFYLSHNLFINDCIYFDTIQSKSVLLTKDKVTGIEVSWKGFETLGVWTPAGLNAPFICIEPWCGSADFTSDKGIFRDKRGIQSLEPNETKKYEMIIMEKN